MQKFYSGKRGFLRLTTYLDRHFQCTVPHCYTYLSYTRTTTEHNKKKIAILSKIWERINYTIINTIWHFLI